MRQIALFLSLSLAMAAQELPKPPMGWGTWNSFGNSFDAKTIMEQARAIVSSGMRDAGYQYVLIDEGWWLGQRDDEGNIVVDPKQWPALQPGEKAGDMANIVRYIHNLGLKAATYTDAGNLGCSTLSPDTGPNIPDTGSLGHYNQDFLQFAKWGFDYVKVDWCGGNKANLDPAVQYSEIARAIRRAEAITHHRVFFSICNWGNQSPWTWGPGVGGIGSDMWRSSGDISAPIVEFIPAESSRWVSLNNVYKNFDAGIHPEAQHTGYFNDMDMMVLGMRGMTQAADRVHMTLWALAASPLIVGADITKLDKADLAVLLNRDLLAVNQDPLGLQCVKVAESGAGLEVWAKPLAQPGERAVMLLNRTNKPAPLTVRWEDIGLTSSAPVSLRDLWAQKDLGAQQSSSYTATVPPNDVVALIARGKQKPAKEYRPSAPPESGTPETTETVFDHVAFGGQPGFVEVSYTNRGKEVLVARSQANDEPSTMVAFAPTGNRSGSIALAISLNSAENTLRFFVENSGDLAIRSIAILPWK